MKINETNLIPLRLPFESWYKQEIEDNPFVMFPKEFEFLSNFNKSLLEPFYKSYNVPKKRGGIREIFAPNYQLKEIQRKIADYLILNKKQSLNVSYGFELNTNMVAGAVKHIKKETVINLDIKDFFQSITKKMIEECLKKNFNLTVLPWKFLEIVTLHDHLPTGAPSSPVLSNIYCYDMDLELYQFSRENKLSYTRYADDLTFSTNEKINKKQTINLITNIVKKYHLEINKEKTKVYNKSCRQEVTGLVVNDKVNLKREFRYNLKAILHNWKKQGYDNTLIKFKQKFPDKNLIPTVQGWIEFLGMVKGKEHPEFKKHHRTFTILCNNYNIFQQFNDILQNCTKK